jgi:hypothetical protein
VVHLRLGNLDGQPNLVLGELLDLGLHPAIQAEVFWARTRSSLAPCA